MVKEKSDFLYLLGSLRKEPRESAIGIWDQTEKYNERHRGTSLGNRDLG